MPIDTTFLNQSISWRGYIRYLESDADDIWIKTVDVNTLNDLEEFKEKERGSWTRYTVQSNMFLA